LPYDLVLSSRNIAFHARLTLLLFEDHARLVVGSANLTPSGFGESADVCAALSLDYANDRWLFDDALSALSCAGARGEGWTRFVRQCQAMTADGGRRPANPRLLWTREGSSVLEQFLAAIPKSARVRESHVMVPTQPEDDAVSGVGALAPLRAFLESRGRNAPLNIAVAWADASVVPPPARQITEPEQLAGYLCAETEGPPGAETIRWHAVNRIDKSKLYLEDRTTPLPRKAVATVMQSEPPRLWAVEEVTGVGLLDAMESLTEVADATWWLFPEVQLRKGQLRRRPFHGRLVGVCATEKGKPVTHLLVGGPNFDRKLSASEETFEIAVHLRLERNVSITELCPQLVPAPAEGFYLEDRSWVRTDPQVPPPLEQAVYDAELHELKLEWQHRAPECRLTYQRDDGEEELYKGRPGLRITISDFVLAHGSTELRVSWDENQALVPVDVRRVAFLRADEPEHALTLKELVALHSNQRRVASSERRLSAQDVFAAQNALVELLASTGQFLSAFEVAMDGPVGLRAYADCLLSSEDCDRAESWLFGLQLCELLRGMSWRGDPFRDEKMEIVSEFVEDLQSRLKAIRPSDPWSADIAKYYGVPA
jgi:hypothetical protein